MMKRICLLKNGQRLWRKINWLMICWIGMEIKQMKLSKESNIEGTKIKIIMMMNSHLLKNGLQSLCMLIFILYVALMLLCMLIFILYVALKLQRFKTILKSLLKWKDYWEEAVLKLMIALKTGFMTIIMERLRKCSEYLP